jgi:uncharacterized protein YgiM (DUF1202 family)
MTMGKFIVGTFLILGLSFYELSGGAGFVPEVRQDVVAAAQVTDATAEVTRADTSALASMTAPAVVAPAPATVVATVQAQPTVPVAVVVQAPAPAPVADSIDLRLVAGDLVNMRDGPGTDFNVVDKLSRGTLAEVIEVNGAGWVRIRVADTAQVGWMAERLLTDS